MTKPHDTREDPFVVCRMPLGAYQYANFVYCPDEEAFGPNFTPPVYTVEFEAAVREPFKIEKCLMLIDAKAANNLAVALRAVASGTPRRMNALERLMEDQQYGEYRR